MRVAIFSAKPYDVQFFNQVNTQFDHDLTFLEARLLKETAALATKFTGVCAFVNDVLDADVLQALAAGGTRFIALRCAGFNNVDLHAAAALGIRLARVPAYSPYAVAEHAVGLMLTLNRKIHRAYSRVREGNFALSGLLGFDMVGRTVGLIGTGEIGYVVARIVQGFGCRVLASDPQPNPKCQALGVKYVELPELLASSDIISLHCPLIPATRYIINAETIAQMKPGVMIINTSRGGVLDTRAVIQGLKSGRVGFLGLDVYEEEAKLFFEDRSDRHIPDDILARLITFPNVIVTGHQAFFTQEALTAIAQTTLQNLSDYDERGVCSNEVQAK